MKNSLEASLVRWRASGLSSIRRRICVGILVGSLLALAGAATRAQDAAQTERFEPVDHGQTTLCIDLRTGCVWRLGYWPGAGGWWWVPGDELNADGKTERPLTDGQRARHRQRLRSWVERVLLSTEFGENRPAIRRWTEPPRISVHGASEREKRVITEVVNRINEVLGTAAFGPAQIVDDNDPTAELSVVIADREKLSSIARGNGHEFPRGNLGSYSVRWNARHEIVQAIVLLDNISMPHDQLKHFAFEEITQAFGVINDSPAFDDSLFFSGTNRPDELVGRDAEVVHFLYRRLRPGDRRSRVRQQFDRHWPRLADRP